MKKCFTSIFHSAKQTKTRFTTFFYKSIVMNWAKCSSDPIDVGSIYGQYLWYNKFIEVAGNPVYWQDFVRAGLCYIGQLYDNHEIKSWIQIKQEFRLADTLQFKFIQMVNAIPRSWKQKLAEDLPIPDLESVKHVQGLLLCTRLIPAENLNSKQIYDIML